MRWQIAIWQRGLNHPSVIAVVALVLLALGWLPSARAQVGAPDWEPTPLTGKALHLFTATSGALFAQIDNDMLRSDDAGTSWSTLNDSDIGAVNDLALSVDSTSLFAATNQGVFRLRLTP